MELISVIVPIYNVEKYLENCIESIIEQSYEKLEVILVDDGSTDNCPNICDKYSKKDKRITVIHQENRGLSSARNSGIDIANGKYLVFIDSDDAVEKDMILKMYNKLKEDESDLVICNYRIIDEIGKFGESNSISSGVWSKSDFWENYYSNQLVFCVVAWNKLYKSEVFDSLRYPVGKYHEDEFVIDKIIETCNKISILNDSLYLYRIRKASIMSQAYSYSSLDRTEAYFLRSKRFFENNEIKLGEKALSRCFASVVFSFKNLNQKIDKNRIRCNELRDNCINLFHNIYKLDVSTLFKLKGFVFCLNWRFFWLLLWIYSFGKD